MLNDIRSDSTVGTTLCRYCGVVGRVHKYGYKFYTKVFVSK